MRHDLSLLIQLGISSSIMAVSETQLTRRRRGHLAPRMRNIDTYPCTQLYVNNSVSSIKPRPHLVNLQANRHDRYHYLYMKHRVTYPEGHLRNCNLTLRHRSSGGLRSRLSVTSSLEHPIVQPIPFMPPPTCNRICQHGSMPHAPSQCTACKVVCIWHGTHTCV